MVSGIEERDRVREGERWNSIDETKCANDHVWNVVNDRLNE